MVPPSAPRPLDFFARSGSDRPRPRGSRGAGGAARGARPLGSPPPLVVSPTPQDAPRADLLGELCYTIPGSDLIEDRKRATLFARRQQSNEPRPLLE